MKKKWGSRLVVSSAAALGAAAVFSAGAGADSSATPVATGCPAGFARLPVSYFEALGPYRLPRRLDTGGNNNGYVCALQLPEAVVAAYCQHLPGACTLLAAGLPLFQLMDDDSPAEGAAG